MPEVPRVAAGGALAHTALALQLQHTPAQGYAVVVGAECVQFGLNLHHFGFAHVLALAFRAAAARRGRLRRLGSQV